MNIITLIIPLIAMCAICSAGNLDLSPITKDTLSRFLMQNRQPQPDQKGCRRFGVGLLHSVGESWLSEYTPNIEDNIVGLLTQLTDPDVISKIKMTKRFEDIVKEHISTCLNILDSKMIHASVKPQETDIVEDVVEEKEPEEPKVEEPITPEPVKSIQKPIKIMPAPLASDLQKPSPPIGISTFIINHEKSSKAQSSSSTSSTSSRSVSSSSSSRSSNIGGKITKSGSSQQSECNEGQCITITN